MHQDSGSLAIAPTKQISATTVVVGVVLATVFVWAYWPTLVGLVSAWNAQADYSHGFLVAPFAVYLLWTRRDRFPAGAAGVVWPGLILLGLSCAMRYVSARYHLLAIDGWSIPIWIAGAVCLAAGWRVFVWSLPCIAFLWFMVPLPFRAERWLSLPLQSVATKASVWVLQCLGQPAISEGHTILLGESRLEVEQACSGLRVLVGIVALAVAYVLVVRQKWWERAFLLLSVIPVAVAANVTRIVATGLLYHYGASGVARKFAHDFAGWVMILLASGMFACVLWYLRALFRQEAVVEVADLIRTRRAAPPRVVHPVPPRRNP